MGIFFNSLGIAAELWSFLTFNRKTDDGDKKPELTEYQDTPLATQSLLLLLVLANHFTTRHNPYRQTLFSCANSIGKCFLDRFKLINLGFHS